jgi:hypothetical protein
MVAVFPGHSRRTWGRYRLYTNMVIRTKSPRGMSAVGIFLFFGATMAFLAGLTFLWPGTVLDRVWALNPHAYKQLAPFGRGMGIPLILLGLALTVAGMGWFKRFLWAWRLAVAIIAIQVVGNFVNIFLGRIVEGAIAVTIAVALLFYLLRSEVKAAFATGNASNVH